MVQWYFSLTFPFIRYCCQPDNEAVFKVINQGQICFPFVISSCINLFRRCEQKSKIPYYSSKNIYPKTQRFNFPKEKEPDLLIWIQYMDADTYFLTVEMCEGT